MGNIIQAICPCGMESEAIFQGIGFSYPETRSQIEPTYCDTCGIVVGRDASKLFTKCPKRRKKVRFYKDELEADEENRDSAFPSLDYQQIFLL